MTRASTLVSVALAVLAAGALGEVPAGPPTFSDPTDFDNPFFPFEPGAYRVYQGREGASKVVFIDVFTSETRTFSWNGGTVTCRVLQETEFEDGELTEISRNFFAEADDGSVYYFGETVDDYEDGAVVGNGGSWVVGTPAPGDPEGILSAPDPALFMPANPEVGDVFKPEDVPDGPEEEAEIVRVGRTVRSQVGRHEDCIEVLEHDVADDEFETKWYAPGLGLVAGKARGESFRLIATTYVAPGE